ncbi:hypothetical protein J4430_03040 [Candidatus Woesearchaeota archaeon]|nr:hypothetical protein [Candidatus Woesearchaeota archaeon]
MTSIVESKMKRGIVLLGFLLILITPVLAQLPTEVNPSNVIPQPPQNESNLPQDGRYEFYFWLSAALIFFALIAAGVHYKKQNRR